MNTLIYSNTGLSSKQIGLTGEVVARLKKDGLNLDFVLCNAILDSCCFNKTKNVLGCSLCQSRLRNILKQAGVRNNEISYLNRVVNPEDIEIPKFRSYEDLFNFHFEGHHIGRAVASSIITYTRDYEINSDNQGDLIKIEILKSINVLKYFERYFEKSMPKEVYLFNGRFSESYPLISLCQKFGIRFNCIEAGSLNNFELYINHLPHCITGRNNSMNKIWKSSEEKDKATIGGNWYKLKRQGSTKYEISYTSKQKEGILPSGFDKTKHNVLLLNSSEDEFKTIPEWHNDIYDYQNEVISKIVKAHEHNSTFKFYLKVHPNLENVINAQMQEIRQMKHKNLEVLFPESALSTYYLMDKCDKVIVFGSQTGIEAAFWGKPSILMGKSYYMHTNSVYVPQNLNEAIKLISDISLPALSKSGAIKYGYFMSRFGIKTMYFNFNGLKKSTFKNKPIRLLYFWSFCKHLATFAKNYKTWRKLNHLHFKAPIGLRFLFKFR